MTPVYQTSGYQTRTGSHLMLHFFQASWPLCYLLVFNDPEYHHIRVLRLLHFIRALWIWSLMDYWCAYSVLFKALIWVSESRNLPPTHPVTADHFMFYSKGLFALICFNLETSSMHLERAEQHTTVPTIHSKGIFTLRECEPCALLGNRTYSQVVRTSLSEKFQKFIEARQR